MWDFESLFSKAQEFVHRGQAHELSDAQHIFWHIQALEMLGRAVLAKTSPTLLAHPKNVANLFYALNIQHGTESKKSINAHEVYSRCVALISDFNDEDVKICNNLASLRNEELHSGGTQISSQKTSEWQPNYYYYCKTFLIHVDSNLEKLFGKK